MDDIRRDTDIFTLIRIVEGEPPAIVVRKLGTDVHGNRRPIERQIPVPNAPLFAEIKNEVAPGDTIEVTEQVHWSQPNLPKEVVAFRTLSPSPLFNNVAPVKNLD